MWITVAAGALWLVSGTWFSLWECWDYWKARRNTMEVKVETVNSLQLRTLNSRDVLSYGQCCNLMLETNSGERWWVCRLRAGETNHRVTKEVYVDGQGYVTAEVYVDKEET